MRVKYNAPSANHRRVIPNPDPNRTEEDPEELVWEASNNFVLELPDGEARKLLDEFPDELEEAAPEEPSTRPAETQRGPKGTEEGGVWVETVEGDQ